jgi:hypothetical protein
VCAGLLIVLEQRAHEDYETEPDQGPHQRPEQAVAYAFADQAKARREH